MTSIKIFGEKQTFTNGSNAKQERQSPSQKMPGSFFIADEPFTQEPEVRQ